ncbi:Uncharacterized protein T310_9776 [Aspergillus lentulus]|nr:Uncharacterized protein T310_9776 [Aspergillus lentulus]
MTKSDDRGEDLSNLALYRSKVPDFKFDEEATSSDGSPVAHLKMMILIAKCHTGAGERAHIPVKLHLLRQPQISASIADLESLAGRMTLQDRPSSHRELPWNRDGDITVYFSDSQHRWYYEDRRGGRVYIQLYEEEHSDGECRAYFIQGAYRHRVRQDRGKQRAR